VFSNVRWRRGAAWHGDGTVRCGFLNRFWSDFFFKFAARQMTQFLSAKILNSAAK
jgi:hypothetical protein